METFMSQAVSTLWNEFYTMTGPADGDQLALMRGAFHSGSLSMLEHLISKDALTKASLPIVTGLLEELGLPTIARMN